MWGGGHTLSDVALLSHRDDSVVVVYKSKAANESYDSLVVVVAGGVE